MQQAKTKGTEAEKISKFEQMALDREMDALQAQKKYQEAQTDYEDALESGQQATALLNLAKKNPSAALARVAESQFAPRSVPLLNPIAQGLDGKPFARFRVSEPKDTPLHSAVATENVHIITQLKRSGINLEQRNAQELTPLHVAARDGKIMHQMSGETWCQHCGPQYV